MNARAVQIARSVGVIGATATLVSGITFAALTSNAAALTDNTVSSATASLKISDGGPFDVTKHGFNITGLIPGSGSGKKDFYLANTGTVPLKLTVHVPAAPPAPADGYGFTGFENLKVSISNEATGGTVLNTDMAALLAGEVALPEELAAGAQGSTANPTAPGHYSVSYDINPDAVTGGHAGVGNFNLVFTGTDNTPAP